MNEYDEYLKIVGKLTDEEISKSRRKTLEKKARKIEKEHPEYRLTGGGGLPDDYDFSENKSGRRS